MRTTPIRRTVDRRLAARIYSPGSPEFATHGILNSATGIASGAWFSANDPLAMPFFLPEPVVVTSFYWRNGSAAGGNIDMGIYDTSFNRLLSTGSTGGSGSSTYQVAEVTDTAIPSGYYYLAMVLDNVTANRITLVGFSSAQLLSLGGCMDSATDAIPLPNPLTNMALTATAVRLPVAGFKAVGFP